MVTSKKIILSVLLLITIALIVFMGVYLISDAAMQKDLLKELGKILLQLILIGVLGVIAKSLLEQFVEERRRKQQQIERNNERQEADRKSKMQLLDAITTNYWQIRKAFLIIDSHKSAKSYGEQIWNIIDHRINLMRIDNEIFSGFYNFDEDTRLDITARLSALDNLLLVVINEWKQEYLRLSRMQKQDDEKVPEAIDALPVLSDIKTDQYQKLHNVFEDAVSPLRAILKNNLEG